jgi:NADPH:quinone reductase-like Zn-dependent oxidoreductase
MANATTGSTTMRALLLDRPGAPSTLRVGEAPIPQPGPGELRIRVRACGLNPVDVGTASAGNSAWRWPHIPGLDAAGEVDVVGAGVRGFSPGQRVVFHGDLRREGGFAEYVVTAADVVATIPDGVDAATAAALPCAGMTAYQAIHRRLRLGAGQTVFITAGSGGVGGFAVQLAHRIGARVLTSTSAGNRGAVRNLGADEVIDYRAEDVPARIRELTGGRGVDAIVDTLGSDSATAGLLLLVHGGGLAAIAGRPDWNAVPEFTTAPSVHEIALGAAHSHGDAVARSHLAGDLAALLSLVAEGSLDPMLSERVPLAGVPAALARLATRHGRGKTVYAEDAASGR